MSTRDEPLMQLCATPLQGTGTVIAATAPDRFTVATARGELSVRRAASCLLQPQAGDRVWLAGDLAEGIYLTAVLERADPASPARIALASDSTLDAGDGALTLRAGRMHLVGEGRLTVQAEAAAVCIGKLTAVGREATWSFGRMKAIGELLETFVERLVQFSRWSQRTVDGMDQLRSAHIDYRADGTLQLQAEHLVANGAKLVKADGEQIHLG